MEISSMVNELTIYKILLHLYYLSMVSRGGILSVEQYLKTPFTVIFSSPGPKGQVSFSHHLASVVRRPSSVVRRPSSVVVNFYKKSSPLKLLGQIKPNLATIIIGVSSLKNVWRDPVVQPRWPPRLKIEHRGKM